METPRIVRLAILESYGVRWTLETFARDVLQNFFDATPDFRDVVTTRDEAAGTLEVRGPSEFDLDLLAYLGATTKNDGASAGGFGEGFKICALVGTRDFGLSITAGAGSLELEVFFDAVPLGRELCYRVRRRPNGRGSFVRLSGCSPECFVAFSSARDMFFHPDNRKLGELVAEAPEAGVAVYLSRLPGRGEIYYRRQLRGECRFWGTGSPIMPITLACHVAIEDLDGDRDRRDLAPESIAFAVGMRLAPEALHVVILTQRSSWMYGHQMLNGLLRAAIQRKLTFAWPSAWLARTGRAGDGALASLAERQGHSFAVGSFAAIGMPTVFDRFRGDLETRRPTPIEQGRIDALAKFYGKLLGQTAPEKEFGVFDSDRAAVLGQHLGERVIVASKLLETDCFEAAAGTVLHELAHDAGGEESAAFQRRLAVLLGAVLRSPEVVRDARQNFQNAPPLHLPEAPPPPLAPFVPHEVDDGYDYSGLRCEVFVPPGFPPSAQLLERLVQVSEETEIALFLRATVVSGEAEAVELKLPGLPTVRIEKRDLEPNAGERTPGYRLRLWGPEQSLLPSVELLRAALVEARNFAESKRQNAVAAVIDPDAAARMEEQAEVNRIAYRNMIVGSWCDSWARGKRGQRGLARAWSKGVGAACRARLRVGGEDRKLTEDELFQQILKVVREGIEVARALRLADGKLDAGDEFEVLAMGAAQGVSLVGFAQPTDGGRARAERDFAAVREVTEQLLEVDLAPWLRDAVMSWSLGAAGLPLFSYDEVPNLGITPAALREAFGVASREARRLQHDADEAEKYPDSEALFTILRQIHEDPDTRARREAEKKQSALASALAARAYAEKTLDIKRIYEETLAATGSDVEAAQRALAAAHGLKGGGE